MNSKPTSVDLGGVRAREKREGILPLTKAGCTYDESTGNHDDDAAVNRGLSIESGDLVLDLLEGKAL